MFSAAHRHNGNLWSGMAFVWHRLSRLIVYVRLKHHCVFVNAHLGKVPIKIGRYVDCDILLLLLLLFANVRFVRRM